MGDKSSMYAPADHGNAARLGSPRTKREFLHTNIQERSSAEINDVLTLKGVGRLPKQSILRGGRPRRTNSKVR